MRSPWNGGSISRRSRRWRSPSSSRIEFPPSEDLRMTFASPARNTSGSPAQICVTAAGSEKNTIGCSIRGTRSENALP